MDPVSDNPRRQLNVIAPPIPDTPGSRSAGGRRNALREKSAYYGTSARYTNYGASLPCDSQARRDHEFQGGVEPWPRPWQCYGSDLIQILQSYILELRFDLYPSRLCLVLHDLTGEVQTFRQSASPMIYQSPNSFCGPKPVIPPLCWLIALEIDEYRDQQDFP